MASNRWPFLHPAFCLKEMLWAHLDGPSISVSLIILHQWYHHSPRLQKGIVLCPIWEMLPGTVKHKYEVLSCLECRETGLLSRPQKEGPQYTDMSQVHNMNGPQNDCFWYCVLSPQLRSMYSQCPIILKHPFLLLAGATHAKGPKSAQWITAPELWFWLNEMNLCRPYR